MIVKCIPEPIIVHIYITNIMIQEILIGFTATKGKANSMAV